MIAFVVSTVSAQPLIETRIKIDSNNPDSLIIEGRFLPQNSLPQNKNWFFARGAAQAENFGERVTEFKLAAANGAKIAVKKFAAGEYVADEPAAAWSYRVELKPPPDVNRLAHVSWFADEQGILMLDDALPQISTSEGKPISARIMFDVPAGWQIISREKQTAAKVFEVENLGKAIFLVGKNWRTQEISVGGGTLNFVTSGDWRFSDDEARQIIADIFAEYRKLFGEIPNGRMQISLIHFPQTVKIGRWQAEARGANLTVLSSEMPFKTLALQRLHEQLRHELFHLWMPNNLALTGNYAWFYEGFTVYQALKTGVAMNRIRFEDFLDTLAQAYNLDNFQTQKSSLLETAKNNRSGAGSGQVYARGMIVAFLCDAALLGDSRGKRSVAKVFQQLYGKHRQPNQSQDGNAAILGILSGYKELNLIIDNYVKKAEKIDWKTDLNRAGIEQLEENGSVRLKVVAKPNGRQKDLLDELGYNNWRKISAKPK